jgi:adenylate cyclase
MGEDRVARRLAAILAADVAGYSRLMGADESGTARTLRDHRAAIDPVVANHGGRIVKTTGDGILLEFPSIVAAVECAIAVQKLMARRNTDVPIDRRMLFRIGINLGDVLIEDGDILGDGINIAARLESISESGGIYISEAAYVQVRDKLDVKFEDIGEQRLKNTDGQIQLRGKYKSMVPALDLALGLRMARGAANMGDATVLQPFRKIARDVARSIIAEQSWFVHDLGAVAA